jgi:ribosomal protein L28
MFLEKINNLQKTSIKTREVWLPAGQGKNLLAPVRRAVSGVWANSNALRDNATKR